jgi:hypothetical protein
MAKMETGKTFNKEKKTDPYKMSFDLDLRILTLIKARFVVKEKW